MGDSLGQLLSCLSTCSLGDLVPMLNTMMALIKADSTVLRTQQDSRLFLKFYPNAQKSSAAAGVSNPGSSTAGIQVRQKLNSCTDE